MSDTQTLYSLMQQARNVSSETLRLPLPRRLELPIAQEYLNAFMGNQLIVIDGLIEEGCTTGKIAKILTEDAGYREWYLERDINRHSMEKMVQCRKFQLEQGRVFTYRSSLCRRLDDMDIGAKVPMGFILPPFSVCYLEFGPSEERCELGYTVYAGNRVNDLEGAYLSFTEDADTSILSDFGRKALRLDPDKPARCLEISFIATPLTAHESQKMALYDSGLFMSMYWTDDDASIEDVLSRHFALYERNPELNEEMRATIRDNLRRITKALLYLRNENRQQDVQNDASNLTKRLADIKNPAKRRKAEKKLDRIYDRVVIGPNTPYRPLSEVLTRIEERSGVRPHIRRAHWSSRWAGKGKKDLRPVKIDAVLVNASALSDDDTQLLRKDYDVK